MKAWEIAAYFRRNRIAKVVSAHFNDGFRNLWRDFGGFYRARRSFFHRMSELGTARRENNQRAGTERTGIDTVWSRRQVDWMTTLCVHGSEMSYPPSRQACWPRHRLPGLRLMIAAVLYLTSFEISRLVSMD